VVVDGSEVVLDGCGTRAEGNGVAASCEGNLPILTLNLETPRAQSLDQEWTITFEGALPRFGTIASTFRVGSDELPDGLYDASGRFCEGGVQSKEAVREQALAAGASAAEAETQATQLADRVEITTSLPAEDNGYWGALADQCTFNLCRDTFGDSDAPLLQRDFVIREAYEDRLLVDDAQLKDKDGNVVVDSLLGLSKCCFPSLVSYLVRPGNQWVVVGQSTGFLHHVVATPGTGECRSSCDPVRAERMNGRVLRTPNARKGDGIKDGEPTAFLSQMFRLAIVDGNTDPIRDMQFVYRTTGAFSPLLVTLVADTNDVAPVGITFIPPTGELAITDGALQGLITVNLAGVSASRQFY